jgi:hypothetical protein
MPYKVIFFEKNREIGSKVWRTKAEAVAHAKEPQFEVTSAIVLDLGSNEIVFGEKLREPLAPVGRVNHPTPSPPPSSSE